GEGEQKARMKPLSRAAGEGGARRQRRWEGGGVRPPWERRPAAARLSSFPRSLAACAAAPWRPSVKASLLVSVLAAAMCGLATPAMAQSGGKDPVVAKVDGTEIRRSEVEDMLEAYGDRLGDMPAGERFRTATDRV